MSRPETVAFVIPQVTCAHDVVYKVYSSCFFSFTLILLLCSVFLIQGYIRASGNEETEPDVYNKYKILIIKSGYKKRKWKRNMKRIKLEYGVLYRSFSKN